MLSIILFPELPEAYCHRNTEQVQTTMATVSAMEEREDSILETHRTSLLEVIEDKNRSLNKARHFSKHIL